MAISDSDEKLYMRFLEKRDSDDLRVLLERYNESLTLFLYGFVKDMEDAEDLMLDAFAVAASGTSRFGMKSSFKTWLFAIGRNLAMKQLRKNRIDAVPLNEEVMTETYQHELGFDIFKEERYAALYRALEQLSPDYRQALYLIYFEDMDNESAAKVMGRSRKQFYNLTSRGKAALKGILERMGFEK